MAGARVLVCDPISDKGLQMLSSAGLEVNYRPKIDQGELLRVIGEYGALVVRSRMKVTKEIIEAGKSLRVIGRAGAGLDNIDVDAAKDAGVTVLDAGGALTNAVAEHVLGLMLASARGICRGDSGIKSGEWLKGELMGEELFGKTIGIIGMGRIGMRVASLAKALGMKILAYDILPIREEVIRELEGEVAGLDALIRRADFVTLHVPLTNETHHMIDGERLRAMKRGAYIINTSRGAVIDEGALLEALKGKAIKGAALDVFEVEPPTLHELIMLPNVVCTPHIAGQTVEAQELAATIMAEKMIEALVR